MCMEAGRAIICQWLHGAPAIQRMVSAAVSH
jgi:hypothetical protein